MSTAKNYLIALNAPNFSDHGDPYTFLVDFFATSTDIIHVVDQYVSTTANDRYTVNAGGASTTLSNPPHTLLPANINAAVISAVRFFFPSGGGGGYDKIYHIILPAGQDACLDAAATQCYSPDVASTFKACAWHTSMNSTDANGAAIHVVYSVEPMQAVTGCSFSGPLGNPSDSTNKVLSHEVIEAYTDPDPNTGWIRNSDNQEIGDICNTTPFLINPITLNGKLYSIQSEYSNNEHVCRGATGAQPSNDNFSSPFSISPGQVVTATNVGAIKELGEPNIQNRIGGASVWWQFTANATGSMTINTTGSSFDTLLGVYTGSSVGGLTLVADNDDCPAGNNISCVTFNVSSGVTYHVAVDGYHGARGNITLATSIIQFPASITSPAQGTLLPGASTTFNWNGGGGVTNYFLAVGNTVGDHTYYYQDQGSATHSVTVSSLPVDGSTVYVRLYSQINGVYQWNDYTYTAASPAAMTSPIQGATLSGSSATFNWSNGGSVSDYFLAVGTAVGDHTYYYNDQGLNHSVTVTGLPTNGSLIYVRLYSSIGGTFYWHDYTYTASSATFTISLSASPAAGGTVSGGGTFAGGSSRTVTATANGGYNFNNWTESGSGVSGASSYTFTLNGNRTLVANFRPTTTTSISNAPNPTVFGQAVTFSATVAPVASGAGTPTGTLTFTVDGVAQSPTSLVSGHASFTTSTLAVGAHTVSAFYNGDGNFLTSASGNASQTINKGSTTATLGSSANPSKVGQSVTFTVNVTATAPATGVPTGTATVNFGDATSIPLNLVNGVASINHSYAQIGTYNVSASYGGDTNFSTSNSNGIAQSVQQGATTTSLTPSVNPIQVGQNVTFTAHVAATSPASGTPTGTVTFKDGGSNLGTISVDGAGTATFSTSSFSVGAHTITVVYNSVGNFTGSTSPSVTETVNQGATTTSVSSSLNPSKAGQAVTFTAHVAVTSPAAGTPVGTVTFKNGAATLGTGAVSAGAAAFTTSSLTQGSHTITAVYGGNANFTGSTSVALTQTVNPASSSQTAAHDFNGDHLSDILWRHTNGTMLTWQMAANGTHTAFNFGTVATAWQIAGTTSLVASTGDVNGGGKSDIVFRHTNGSLSLWEMNGGTAHTPISLGAVATAWQIAGVGDFDGDGHADILWRHTNGSVSIWKMAANGTHTALSLGAVATAWQVAGIGDVNGDGKADIVWRHTNGSLLIWRMTGGTSHTVLNLGAVATAWQIVGVGDVDGDGNADLFWRHTNGSLSIWKMAANGTHTVLSPGAVATAWQVVSIGDYNGDGRADILWRHTNGTALIWTMNANGTHTSVNLGAVATAWTVVE